MKKATTTTNRGGDAGRTTATERHNASKPKPKTGRESTTITTTATTNDSSATSQRSDNITDSYGNSSASYHPRNETHQQQQQRTTGGAKATNAWAPSTLQVKPAVATADGRKVAYQRVDMSSEKTSEVTTCNTCVSEKADPAAENKIDPNAAPSAPTDQQQAEGGAAITVDDKQPMLHTSNDLIQKLPRKTNASNVRFEGLEALRQMGLPGVCILGAAFLFGACTALTATTIVQRSFTTSTEEPSPSSHTARPHQYKVAHGNEEKVAKMRYAENGAKLPNGIQRWLGVPFSCRLDPPFSPTLSHIKFAIKTNLENFDRFRFQLLAEGSDVGGDSNNVVYQYEGAQNGISFSSNGDSRQNRLLQWDKMSFKTNSTYEIDLSFPSTNAVDLTVNETTHKMFTTSLPLWTAHIFSIDGDLQGILKTNFSNCKNIS